ncbi:amidohydrolase [Tenacibaculum discolor]|uniref:Amidohydrolase n=1 Tax=Tenacibaculum discolor TaxID=361581 RepID=A0A2G1BSC5_9FLAO|nr:amidohydrolase [Tenacibaculum discolor]MDP2542302.1 amidohydrolase [Tenacibaculum discolor]PHN96937.1 amidohydrolase [Tenacibaculum discolor]
MESLKDTLEKIRKELHKFPEVSEKEYETKKRIQAFLKEHTSCDVLPVAKTGVLAIFDGNKEGKTVMLRADIDALPIQEINSFEHKSVNEGVSHKCGHDGHTAILLGVAKLLTEKPLHKGKIVLLFQPSEENGRGAQSVLEDSSFKELNIDYAFALHNLPGFTKQEIVVKKNEFTSNVKSVVITLEGKTAHAAEPEKGFNPANAIAKILHFIKQETKNTPEDSDFFLATPVHITMGEKAYGVSAGYGEVHLTLRSWSTSLMNEKQQKIEQLLQKLEEKEKLNINTSWFEEFYANKNDKEAVDYIKKAATKQKLSINEITTPFKWGEDFGLFTQQFKGAIFGLGAGKDTPALHNPDYDFPDEVTVTGAQLFYNILKEVQQ